MNKLIIVIALVAAVTCEPPSSYGAPSAPIGGGDFSVNRGSSSSGSSDVVDDALLARISQLLTSGGDGSGGSQTNEASQYVDESIFSRVSQLLNQEGGSSGGSSGGYGAPARSSGPAQLGQPEVAQRIAEFALGDDTRQSSNNGGYQSAPAPQQPSGGYQSSGRSSSSGGAITLGRPEVARRVADFAAASSSSGTGRSSGYAPPQQRGGY